MTFTVLESILTISGKLRIVLNSFDIQIPVNARLFDANNYSWTVTGVDKEIFLKFKTESNRKAIELGAVLYHIEPINHNLQPKVGDQLTIR